MIIYNLIIGGIMRKLPIGVSIPMDLVNTIDELAAKDNRTRSNLIVIWLQERVNAELSRTKRNGRGKP